MVNKNALREWVYTDSLEYNSISEEVQFKIHDDAITHFIGLHRDSLDFSSWIHISGMLYQDTMSIFLNGKRKASLSVPGIQVNTSTNDFVVGSNLKGFLKEIRMWNSGKTEMEQEQDYSRFLAGNESGLRLYIDANEGRGDFAYDFSRIGNSFNKNHLELSESGMWSSIESPGATQLNIAAFTNSNGAYTLIVPYFGSGQSYTLTPSFGTHRFDPSTRSIFIGDASSVQNDVDFNDISSFRVTGRLLFDNTNCPSANVFIRIDGEVKVQNGQPIKTDNDGFFDIQVPIGPHVLELERTGHVFSAGRFPSDENQLWDFQENVTGIEFYDGTLRKVIGRASCDKTILE